MTEVDDILDDLRRAGLLADGAVDVEALTGGVSSSIHVIRQAGRSFVVKRALERLKVAAEWRADVARNDYEQKYMRYVSGLSPDSVPGILHANQTLGYFAMEFLSGGWRPWKTDLLAGRFDPAVAREAGRLLGVVHQSAHGDAGLAREFATDANFHQLRLEPYLLTTGQRHPSLQARFEAESARLARTRETLVHGDFSPKNMLVDGARLVLLDCEVAWFGDPCFDAAFLVNHLLLKELLLAAQSAALPDLVAPFLASYFAAYRLADRCELERRIAGLLPLLLLARVDGKSPVEYLDGPMKEAVRLFAYDALSRSPDTVHSVHSAWRTVAVRGVAHARWAC